MIKISSQSIRSKLRSLNKAKILILGLDSAGKTTLSKYIRSGEYENNSLPTIGQNINTFKFDSWMITAVDVAGQKNFRFLWEAHYHGSSAIIFVIDAADFERLPEAKDILEQQVFYNPRLDGVPILVLANKQDLPGAVDAPLLIQLLGLHKKFLDRTFAVFDCSLLFGKGILESFMWLVDELEMKKDEGK